MNQQIINLDKKIRKIQEQIKHYSNTLLDADDPIEFENLTVEEKSNVNDKIYELQCKEKNIESEIMNKICEINPQIKISNFLNNLTNCDQLSTGYYIENISSHDIKFLLYNLICKCPELLQNEYNIEIIYKFIHESTDYYTCVSERIEAIKELSSFILKSEKLADYLFSDNFHYIQKFLCSDILIKDEKLQEELENLNKEKLQLQYYRLPYISMIEAIFRNIPSISRRLLLKLNDKNYFLEHVDDLQTLEKLFLIHELVYEKKDREVFEGSLLEDIFNVFDSENSLKKFNNKIDKLKIAILLNCADDKIVSHFKELINDENYIVDNSTVSIAMLKALSTSNQDKLSQFIQIDEIREELKNKQGFYYNFLIEQIKDDFYGDVSSIFNDIDKNDPKIKEKLANYFNDFNLKNIYFYNNNKLQKAPVTFYQQFVTNVFSNNYLSHCRDENQMNNFFCNFNIIMDIVDNDYICAARNILKQGINQTEDYNIDDEILWNRLFLIYHENMDESMNIELETEMLNKINSKKIKQKVKK